MAHPEIHAPTEQSIARAADILRAGGLVAFPTETVYGLGADATDARAVAGIFEAKRRPSFNPLISHVANIEAALALGVFSKTARLLADKFWPGPLTLVVPRTPDCPIARLTSADLDSVALRVPAHPIAHRLLTAAGRPIAAPSANISGRVSPTTAAHVTSEFEDGVELVLDGGPTEHGLESTVIDVTGEVPTLLRPGSVTREMIEELIGPIEIAGEGSPITAPGMLASHYAPSLPVRLNADAPRDGEIFLGFGALPAGAEGLTLSTDKDLREAAANLFAMMRELDQPGSTAIAVAPIPKTGLGQAINDRLRRSAAPR